jgi:ATPase subunit of ABC transporter with duplicated ATPase domains
MTTQPMTRQPATAIRVRGLEKSYPQKKEKLRVLRGVDFDVARGSIFALLGSNGAGKTTVVNILSALLKADAGTATVNCAMTLSAGQAAQDTLQCREPRYGIETLVVIGHGRWVGRRSALGQRCAMPHSAVSLPEVRVVLRVAVPLPSDP